MPDTRVFIITVTDGKVKATRALYRPENGQYAPYGAVDLPYLPIPALQLGLKIEAEIPPEHDLTGCVQWNKHICSVVVGCRETSEETKMDANMDILIDKDDGRMRFVVLAPMAISRSSEVPPDHPTRKALEIGLRTGEFLSAGEEFGEIRLEEMEDSETQHEWSQIVILMKPVEPPESTGLEWLKSLPVGTRIHASPDRKSDKYIIVEDGAYRVGSVPCLETWRQIEGWTGGSWATAASAANCPPWQPETEPETVTE